MYQVDVVSRSVRMRMLKFLEVLWSSEVFGGSCCDAVDFLVDGINA